MILGISTPIVSPGLNFSSQNLFSQIIAQLPQKNLSEVNPLGSLGNVTAPLDNIWRYLGRQLNIIRLEDVKTFIDGTASTGLSKSTLEGRLGLNTTSGTSLDKGLGIAKGAFILTMQILIAALELVMGLLKGALSLVK